MYSIYHIIVHFMCITSGGGAIVLGIRNATARNILKGMEEGGFLARTEDRLYRPGGKGAEMNRVSELGEGRLAASRELIRAPNGTASAPDRHGQENSR